MAWFGSFIAGHPYSSIASFLVVCAIAPFFYKDVVIRIRGGHSVHLFGRGRQSKREELPAITGLWRDVFDVDGDKRVAVLEITYGPEGYSIEGEQFDSKLNMVEHWHSIAAVRQNSELEYLYHAQTGAHSRRNDLKGITSLLFHTKQGDMFATYSGNYVSVWRDRGKSRPECNDLNGRRLHQDEIDRYPQGRKAVAKYIHEQMRWETSTRKNFTENDSDSQGRHAN